MSFGKIAKLAVVLAVDVMYADVGVDDGVLLVVLMLVVISAFIQIDDGVADINVDVAVVFFVCWLRLISCFLCVIGRFVLLSKLCSRVLLFDRTHR